MKLKNRGEPLEKTKINQKGFTLIEIMLMLALLSIVIGIAYSMHFVGNKSFEVSKDIGFAQQDARIISEYLNRELKYSSKISKDDYEEGRYYSIELRDNDDGTKTLIKTEYEGDGTTNETKLLSKDWKDIKIGLEQGNRTIKGLITIKLSNNTDYELAITIPLENIKEVGELPNILSSTDKVYYALPEDILIADVGDGENTPGDGEGGDIDDGENGDNDNGDDDPGNPEYPVWKSSDVYSIGDIVSHNDKKYIKREDWGVGHEPGINHRVWHEMSEEWLSYSVYSEGDIVIYGGKKYRSKQWNTNRVPSSVTWAWEPLQ